MKNIIELQRKTAQLTEDIRDVLHAAHINLQAIMVETSQLGQSLPGEFAYLHSLLLSLQKLIDERSQLHMGFLITRQIQEEEERVRRERLSDYEEKIYDQRRIISDKEGFFESLLRPKKKRLPHQTADEFQEIRARERESEERLKIEILTKELSDIQALKRFIEIQERDACFRQKIAPKQANCSLSVVNSTALSQHGEFATEQIIPIADSKIRKEAHSHNRTNSLQHSMVRDTPQGNQEGTKEEQGNIGTLIGEISELKAENEQLHHIYDQECVGFKFKKGQCSRALKEYDSVSKDVVEARSKLQKVKEEERWRHERCSRPVKAVPRSSSSGHK